MPLCAICNIFMPAGAVRVHSPVLVVAGIWRAISSLSVSLMFPSPVSRTCRAHLLLPMWAYFLLQYMWNWIGKYNILRVADLSRHEWNAIEWNVVHSLIYCLNGENQKKLTSVLTRCYVSYTTTLVCRPLCPTHWRDGRKIGRVKSVSSITRAGIWRMWIFYSLLFPSKWNPSKINKFLGFLGHQMK